MTKPDPQTTSVRVKLSQKAIDRRIRCLRNRETLGTLIPWKNPDLHPMLVKVLWDGTKYPQTFHHSFVEEAINV